MNITRHDFRAAAVAVLVLGASAAYGQGGPEVYYAQIEAALPAWTTQILAVQTGPDWMAGLNVGRVSTAVDDSPPPNVVQSGPRVEARDPADTHFVKIDYSEGYVRYASKLRRFDWDTSPHTAVPATTAAQIVQQVLGRLNIPSSEQGLHDIDTVNGQMFDVVDGVSLPTHQRERMVTTRRVINGLPVLESHVRMSVSNLADVARLQVLWPRFVVPPNQILRTRPQVVAEIANRIFDAEEGTPVELQIGLAYARFGDNYLPVAVAAISEPETSPNESDAGLVEIIPLVAAAPDRDQDGFTDTADNCPDDYNLDQMDRDGDGVGDACDNCPSTGNGTQTDANGDGIGNVCSGACCTGGTCTDGVRADCVFVCDVTEHLPPTFLGCFGDADGNGVVNPGDRGVISANIGQTDPVLVCVFDEDGNGVINPGDRGIVSANIGQCTALPDYQNGSGNNGGVPDTRFGAAAVYRGDGTVCATIVCP